MKLILQVECTFLFTLFFFSRHYESALKLSKISIKDKWFVDENDRVVTFRGINAVKKSYPWIPNEPSNDLTNPKHINNLKQWGFNVVRLGFMWSGLMPKKNFINSTYLNEMVDIVNNLADVGIYTIIDLHQDMFSSKFGSYDGVPLWILNEMPNSKFDFPWPLKNSTLNVSLFAAYATESCSFAFQCLYDNTNNFTDYFELYWSIIAKTFSNTTSVLGYELLNEPWAGDIFANPLLLLPGFAGKFNLMKLYDRTYETIRRYDADTLVFYEPVTWGVLFNMNILGTGFTRPPCNDYKKTVLSWHYYCWMLEFKENPLVNDTYPLFIRIMCDKVQLKASFEAIKLDHMILGSPTFLTEFGVCAFGLNNSQGLNTEECEHVLDAAERYLQSWTYW
jgi:endoglycosylceramidase